MLKTAFQKELTLQNTLEQGSKGADVKRVQEWLSLNALRFPEVTLTTNVDGQFGPATRRAVCNFEDALDLPRTGIVSPELFAQLSKPLSTAFQAKAAAPDVRRAVVQVAQMHLRQRATELQNTEAQNLGPWVRSYCDGLDGSPFKWCAGFVQTILDQVASAHGRSFTAIMPQTLSCDVMALSGQRNGRLIDNALLQKDPSQMRPGDVFLLRYPKAPDWYHTGFISRVDGDVVETIEGNTDSKGSSNGTAVFARVRNFRKTTMDVFSIDGL
ncbi:peptidoglycan-binding protein [Spirosoma soli]|uniref:Peptidoglycan-binding protein n=1 Tax=Spirosoma soli TaxID=1770529 RepID=A0ABW5M6E9_9BACT